MQLASSCHGFTQLPIQHHLTKLKITWMLSMKEKP